MYIHEYMHVDSHVCTFETRFTFLQLQTDTNEVRKNRTEVLGPPPEPDFCVLSFLNDRGSPLAPSDSVLLKQAKEMLIVGPYFFTKSVGFGRNEIFIPPLESSRRDLAIEKGFRAYF